jgi:6-phosphogluconolactonase
VAKTAKLQKLTNTTFYFGDERCVPPDHTEGNYSMAMRTLFTDGVPNNCKIHRMQADKEYLETVAKEYEVLLPNNIHILLLGIGEDGHMASLFPNTSQLHEKKRRCLPITGPKPPCERLTVTLPVLTSAETTYILVSDRSKKVSSAKEIIVEQSKLQPTDINSLPIQMVKNPVWCFS